VKAGLIGTAGGVASWLLTLPAGALVDRWNRKWTMIASVGCTLAAYGSVAVAGVLDQVTLVHLAAAAFVVSCADAFFEPAQNAAIPRVVETTQLPQAMANDQARGALAGLIGSPLGGALLAVGRFFPFIVSAIALAVSWLLLFAIRRPLPAPARTERTHLVADIREGLRFIWEQAFIRAAIPIAMLVNLGVGGLLLVVNLHLYQVGVAPAAIGVIDMVAGVCAIAGSLVAGKIMQRVRLGTIVMVVLWAFALVCIPIPLTNNPFVIGALLGLAMLVNPVANAAIMSYKMAITPDRLQGRSTSAIMFLVMLMVPIAPALGGFLLGHFGHYTAMYTFVALVVIAAVLASFAKAIRSVPHAREWSALNPDNATESVGV
jgi:MFS family permease